jgi:predicted RNase H-like HicB family nuclease
MRYAIVIEKAAGNYSAYVPDRPGCVATAATVEAVEAEIRDAIRFRISLDRPSHGTRAPKPPHQRGIYTGCIWDNFEKGGRASSKGAKAAHVRGLRG